MGKYNIPINKAARNQALMREINERIDELAGKAWHPELLCECADPECLESLEIWAGEYQAIRSSPVRFPIKPGHDYPDFERVVERNERYAVVEKFGEAARVVQKLDPRSRVSGGLDG
jgi:hypothetical protein